MNFEKFSKANINLVEQDWKLRPYQQQHSQIDFLPNLSIIDLLMNVDVGEYQAILKG
jgi:hypothetical protein